MADGEPDGLGGLGPAGVPQHAAMGGEDPGGVVGGGGQVGQVALEDGRTGAGPVWESQGPIGHLWADRVHRAAGGDVSGVLQQVLGCEFPEPLPGLAGGCVGGGGDGVDVQVRRRKVGDLGE